MSKIEEEGFLSAESESGRIYLIDKYGDFFNFGKNINKLCMSFLVQIKVDWEDDHKLVIQAMYMRTVEMFQGIYLMLERGMMPEAKILARSMLEVTFMLVALQKKPALLDNYKDKHEDSHLKALKSALKFKNNNLKKAVKDNNIDPESMKYYLESFSHGSIPHGGCGFGLERLTAYILDLNSVKMASFCPRDPKRIVP